MKKKKIVVVEDEPDIVDVVIYNFQREGYLVLAAERGDEGLNLIRSERPDLVLLDLMLPGMDGLSICRQMKSDDSLREIPIIIASAKGEESDVVIGLEMGADDYLPKPCNLTLLRARVCSSLEKKFRYDEDLALYRDLKQTQASIREQLISAQKLARKNPRRRSPRSIRRKRFLAGR